MENTFGKPYSGTETWKISDDEQIFEMLEESDFESNLIETSGVMNTNIYGNTESVKTYRPKCYFTGRPASISGKAGPNEKYEKLLVCRDKNGVPHEPKRVPINKVVKDVWRSVIYTEKVKRGDIELGVSLYDEQEEQGRLPL